MFPLALIYLTHQALMDDFLIRECVQVLHSHQMARLPSSTREGGPCFVPDLGTANKARPAAVLRKRSIVL